MDYADAMNALNDAIAAAIWAAVRNGLTDKEIAEELRRIADEEGTYRG